MNKDQTSLSKLKFRHLHFKKGDVSFCGYTLVEIIVVVASTGLIMTSVIGIVLGSLKAQNRNSAVKKAIESGSAVINELRKNVFDSSHESVVCADDHSSVDLKNTLDANTTTLSCDKTNNKIASSSAERQNILNSNDIKVTDCANFVSCEKDADGTVVGVLFNFSLEAEVSGIGVSQTFNTRITLRN